MKVIVTFSGGKDSLAALLWTREHITIGNKYPGIRDDVRYVEWQHTTGSLFDDDTATNCMSYYGLCE